MAGYKENDGLTHSQMQASLTSAKESRKRAELDAQLLANRIALLKQEEEKAWKKIDETRKRAQGVTDRRAQNEQKFAEKEEFYKDKWNSIRQAQDQNAHNRDRAKASREATKQGLINARVANANRTKQQSQEYMLQKREREAQQRQANAERSNAVKTSKEEAKRRLEEEKLAQMERYREDYETRTAQEELLRSRTDAMVAQMEKEEMEIIQRLQNTQSLQRSAYEELETALGHSSQQISTSQHSTGVRNGGKGEPRRAA